MFPSPLKAALLALAAVSLLSSAAACSCAFGTFEQLFARSATVVLVKVVRVKASPTPQPSPCVPGLPCALPFPVQHLEFKLRLRRVLKGCGPRRRTFFARSTVSPGRCGMALAPGDVYLLNLYKEVRGKPPYFNVNSCQGNRLFSTLTRPQRRFLRNAGKPVCAL